MTRLAVAAAAALLTVDPAPARRTHTAAFTLLFAGIDGGGQLTVCWILSQAGHVQGTVGKEHTGWRHDEKPSRVEGKATTYAIREVRVASHTITC